MDGAKLPIALVVLAAAACGCDIPQGSPPSTGTSRERPKRDAAVKATRDEQANEAPRAARPDDWFEDATAETGIDYSYRNGREAGRFLLIESYGGGCAAIDYDLDDRVDLYFTGKGTISKESPPAIGGLPGVLYRNHGQWRFEDVSTQSGVDAPSDYSQGCAVSDYNGDGFPDLLICAYGRTQLLANQGDGSFRDVTESAGLPTEGYATAAAFGDFDRDAHPDLMLVRYADWSPELDVKCYDEKRKQRDLCGPDSYAGTPCVLLHNSGAGHFEDWSSRLGKQVGVHGLGVVAGDLDQNGWIDFFVASDAMPNQLFLGGEEGLHERGVAAGVALGEWGQPEANMGIDVGDFDGDGLPDIFVTHFDNEDHGLYRGLGGALWVHATVSSGLSATNRVRSGFGTAMADFNGDGWSDIFVLNGNPVYTRGDSPFEQASQLFENQGGKRFVDITSKGGPFFEIKQSGRGNTLGDFDNNGALDMATVAINDPVRILRNRHEAPNHVRVRTVAIGGERDATGARVSAAFQGRRIVQFVVRGAGYFSQFDPRLVVLVEEGAQATDVTVAWPGRGEEVYRGLGVGRTHTLVEGRGEAISAAANGEAHGQ
jgi:hypothetical protein